MLVVSNWKCYVDTPQEAKQLLTTAKRLAARSRKVKLVLAPPAPYLAFLAAGNRTKVAFASQDVSDATVRAATGEDSAMMIRAAGARYAIIGHSERRARGESDVLVAEKVKRALGDGLIPIVCIGEKERDEDASYLAFIKKQIAAVYSPLSPKERTLIILAYEPVWAIGKSAGDALASADLAEMVLYIRKVLNEYLPGKNAKSSLILYGGSVEASNVRSITDGSGIDGLLVGRASSDPTTFSALIKALS